MNFKEFRELGIRNMVLKELGSTALIKPYLELLKVREIIDMIAPMERKRDLTHGQVIEVLIANRLDAPQPLLHIREWALDSGIEEAYGISPDSLNDDRLGRAMDAIAPDIDEIQSLIALELIERYNIDSNLVLWDTTSCYFEGAYEESDYIELGYSRDKKPHKKQIVTGLNLSKEGIPLAHNILPGRSSDKKEALNNIQVLQKSLRPKKLLLVGDRAVLTKTNIPALKKQNVHYLGPFAAAEKDFILSIPDEEFQPLDYSTSKGKQGYYGVEKELRFRYKGKEYHTRALVVKSDEKASVTAKTRAKNLEKIKAGLQHICSKLNQRKYKKRAYTEEQIGKLFNRKKKYRVFFNIELTGEDGALSLNWHLNEEALAQEKRLDGKYILVTSLSQEEYPSSELLKLYKSRHLNESRFRALKSDLRIRPVFLKNDERIKALLFINILALTLYCLIEWLCRQNNLKVTARKVLKKLKKIRLLEVQMMDGRKAVQLGNIDDDVKTFFDAVGVPLPFGFG